MPSPVPPRSAEQRARDIEIHGELKASLLDPDPLNRVRQLSEHLMGLEDSEVPAVAELLRNGAPGLGPVEVALLIRRWALVDPVDAAQFALVDADLWLRYAALDALMEAWGSTDPEAAGKFLASHARLAEGPIMQNAQAGYVRGWYKSGKPGLLTWIYALGADIQQQRSLTALSSAVLQNEGPEALTDYLAAFPEFDDRFKRTIFRQAGEVLAKHDPQLAVAWCETACPGPHGAHVLAMVAKTWALQDGPAAMAWLRDQPPGEERDRAVEASMFKWRVKDEDDITRWIGRQNPAELDPYLVPSAATVARLLSFDYPEVALEWAAKIPNERARTNAYVAITRRYREVDEQGALARLETLPLSPEQKEEAMQPFPNGATRGDRPYPPVVNLLAPDSGES